jgi:hypothetical protein
LDKEDKMTFTTTREPFVLYQIVGKPTLSSPSVLVRCWKCVRITDGEVVRVEGLLEPGEVLCEVSSRAEAMAFLPPGAYHARTIWDNPSSVDELWVGPPTQTGSLALNES